MARSKVEKVARVNYEQVDTIVGADVTFVGDISSTGSVRYEGTLKGNTSVDGNLIVGRNAFISGNIKAKVVHIIGTVEGIITCEQLKILSTGKLTGDIYVDSIIIDEGAIFIGNCKIKEDDESTKIEEIIKSEE